MAQDPLPFLVPGLLVTGGALALALRVLRLGPPTPSRRSLTLLFAALGGFAVIGWVVRPLLGEKSTAFAVGVLLVAWETLLHGLLLGFVAHLPSRHARWIRFPGVAVAIGSVLALLGAAVVLVPHLFIGRVGTLAGVPGLYRLDAGPAAVAWAGIMIAVRAYAVWVATDAARQARAQDWVRTLGSVAWGLALFLGLFLVWLSNPVVIHFTGSPYLPGVVRFALPLAWTAVLLGGLVPLCLARAAPPG